MSPAIKKVLYVVVGIALLVAAGVAKRLLTRGPDPEAERHARLQSDVKSSVDKAMSGFKLCPLSEPGCNDKK